MSMQYVHSERPTGQGNQDFAGLSVVFPSFRNPLQENVESNTAAFMVPVDFDPDDGEIVLGELLSAARALGDPDPQGDFSVSDEGREFARFAYEFQFNIFRNS